MGVALAYLVGFIRPSILLSIPRQKLAVLLAAPLVLGYAWLGQPSASLIRAATMYAFWGILLLQGRGRVLMDGLFFALAVIVFIFPLSVFDLSLQMSAVAVGGIGLMYPRFRFLFNLGGRWWQCLLGWVGGLLAISLCANIALLPLISWYFGSMSPNLLLNLIWLPVLGFVVMPLGLLGMSLSSFAWTAPFGWLFLGWASMAMDWLLGLLHLAESIGCTPVLSVLRPLWPEIVGFVVLLVTAIVAWGNRSRVHLGLAGIGFAFIVLPHLLVMTADSLDKTRLTMLDVGLGQSLVISLPGGHRWLVDGGGGSKNFDLGEAVVAPFLTYGRAPRLDGVFMTHPDSDHSHGLPFILSRFDVGAFYTNGVLPRGRTGKNMRKAFELRDIVPISLVNGNTLGLGSRTVLEVLHPGGAFKNSNTNEHSLVMRLVHNGYPLALLPGDIEKNGIEAVMTSGRELESDVLILPHHGSKSSYSLEFYQAVSPKMILCSNGYLNRYGFPSSLVLRAFDVPIISTSDHGQAVVIWDKDDNMSVRAFRP
jgi:competence protein ComEC